MSKSCTYVTNWSARTESQKSSTKARLARRVRSAAAFRSAGAPSPTSCAIAFSLARSGTRAKYSRGIAGDHGKKTIRGCPSLAAGKLGPSKEPCCRLSPFLLLRLSKAHTWSATVELDARGTMIRSMHRRHQDLFRPATSTPASRPGWPWAWSSREIGFVSQKRRGRLSALRLCRLPKAHAWSTTVLVDELDAGRF